MVGKKIDLKVYKGDDESFTFLLKDAIGRPLDLSLFSAFAADIKKDKKNTTIIASFTFDATNSDLVNGKIVLTLDKTDTAILPRMTWYDFQFQNVDGKVSTPFRGNIICVQDTSRPPPFIPGSP